MTLKKRTAAKSKRPSARKRAAADKRGPVRTAKALAAKVEMQPLYGVPRRIFDIKKPTPKVARARVVSALGIRPVDAEARATAEASLKKIAKTLRSCARRRRRPSHSASRELRQSRPPAPP